MSYVLRRIDKERWDKSVVYAEYPWLKPNDIPPACLINLADKDNDLSLWYVEGKSDPNLIRICAALAATRNPLQFEYGLFDINDIEEAGFVLHETPGQVPDDPDDPIAHLHRDITELTAQKLLKFLEAIWDNVETGRVEEKELAKLIIDGVQFRQWDRAKVKVNGAWLKKYRE